MTHSSTTCAHLFACAALAAFVAHAHAQKLCDSVHIGNETKFAVRLPERRVEPEMFTMEINEPNVCSDSEAVGLKVMACDTERAPRVVLLDTSRGVVVREGSVSAAAYVYTTVYCAAESDEASHEAAESTSSILSPTPPTPLASQSDDEPSSVPTSLTDEYLSPEQSELQYPSLDQLKGLSLPIGLSSRLQDLLKERAVPPRESTKSQSFQEVISSRLQKNEPSWLDEYSLALTGLPQWPPKQSSSLVDKRSLAKRLEAVRPKNSQKMLANRSPAWLKRPTRRPSSPWRRYLTDEETRKSMMRSRYYPASRTPDYSDPRTPYDDDQMSQYPSEEQIDPYYGQTQRIDHPSSSSVKHISKQQTKYHQPPMHEGNPALLEWIKDLHRSPRPQLPKLLLLLQEQDQLPEKKCASAHSVEDAEPSDWSNVPYRENTMETNRDSAWAPDYPTDYSADDGDTRPYFPVRYNDNREQFSQVTPAHKEQPWCAQCALEQHTIDSRKPKYVAPANEEPPWCAMCAAKQSIDARKLQHSPQHSSQHSPQHSSQHSPQHSPPRFPADVFSGELAHPLVYYSPTPVTQRPYLTSTVRHSLSRVKSPKSASAMKQQPSSMVVEEPLEHEYPESPWKLLSQLLLSHPYFRDSTHVIRVR